MKNIKRLALSWSVSRGRDTYGYNICRLDDTSTEERFKCMGGGYDMQGTVFGSWLEAGYQDRLVELKDRANYFFKTGETPAQMIALTAFTVWRTSLKMAGFPWMDLAASNV